MALHDFNPNTHIGPMPSPCIGLCRMDAANAYCQGCWRSMDEIVHWSVASESKKKHIWLELLTRSAGA